MAVSFKKKRPKVDSNSNSTILSGVSPGSGWNGIASIVIAPLAGILIRNTGERRRDPIRHFPRIVKLDFPLRQSNRLGDQDFDTVESLDVDLLLFSDFCPGLRQSIDIVPLQRIELIDRASRIVRLRDNRSMQIKRRLLLSPSSEPICRLCCADLCQERHAGRHFCTDGCHT